VLAAAGLLLFARVGSASAQDLTIAVRGGPETMDPHFSSLTTNASALRHIFGTLVVADPDQTPQPGLAESWRPVDDTTWEFRLRRGVRFHDGREFNAHDVKFSIERVPGATGPASNLQYVQQIATTEVVDDHTVRFRTHVPSATLPLYLVRVFMVSHTAARDARLADFNAGRAAVGTGPYRLVSWSPGTDLVLERFDGHWRGPSHWRRVVYREIANDGARVAALLAGDVDVISHVPPPSLDLLRRNSAISVFSGPSAFNFLLFPDQRPDTPLVRGSDGRSLPANPLADIRVRQALSLAINREGIAERVMDGAGAPANQMVPQGIFGFSARIPPAAYDVAQARRLLEEAGYPNGFRLTLHCTSDRLPNDGKVCEALGQMFTRIGVRTTVEAIPRAVFFTRRAAGEFSLFMHGWGTVTGESSQVIGPLVMTDDRATGYGSWNRIGYSSSRVDGALLEGVRTLDDARRAQLFEQAMETVISDAAAIPITNLSAIWAARNAKVASYEPRSDEDTLAYFVAPRR
jgi:peptide/nickel transport system substrate-binding protein